MVDEHRWFDTMFICYDVIELRVVGNVTASFIVILPNSDKRFLSGGIMSTRFPKIRHYSVAKWQFHTIRIDIRTAVSHAVGFEGGKVFIKLHFQNVISM